MYGLGNAKVKFIFDGEELEDDDTPESLDIEDETIIDVKVCISVFAQLQIITLNQIDVNLYENAVLHASESSKRRSQASTGSLVNADTTPASASAATGSVPVKSTVDNDMLVLNVDINVSDQVANERLTKPVVSLSVLVHPDWSIQRLHDYLIQHNHLNPSLAVEYTLTTTDYRCQVLELTSTVQSLGLNPTSKIIVLPARIKIHVRPNPAVLKIHPKLRNLTLTVRRDYPISAILDIINSNFSVPQSAVALEFGSVRLRELLQTLEEYKIGNASVLSIVPV